MAARPKALEVLQGDLQESASLTELVKDCQAVVHCAGAVRGATVEDFQRVNVAATRRLAEQVVMLPDRVRFLLISSLAAREPGLSAYAASKRDAERVSAETLGGNWVALRPPAVYGPGDRELLPLFLAMYRGLAPRILAPGARVSLLYVEDLASAVSALLEPGCAVDGVFDLHDGRAGGYDWGELLHTVAALRDGPVRSLPVPLGVLRLLARLNLLTARLTGHAPMLTPGKLRELRHPDWVCDNSALRAMLDWRPAFGLAAGLRRTLAVQRDYRG